MQSEDYGTIIVEFDTEGLQMPPGPETFVTRSEMEREYNDETLIGPVQETTKILPLEVEDEEMVNEPEPIVQHPQQEEEADVISLYGYSSALPRSRTVWSVKREATRLVIDEHAAVLVLDVDESHSFAEGTLTVSIY